MSTDRVPTESRQSPDRAPTEPDRARQTDSQGSRKISRRTNFFGHANDLQLLTERARGTTRLFLRAPRRWNIEYSHVMLGPALMNHAPHIIHLCTPKLAHCLLRTPDSALSPLAAEALSICPPPLSHVPTSPVRWSPNTWPTRAALSAAPLPPRGTAEAR